MHFQRSIQAAVTDRSVTHFVTVMTCRQRCTSLAYKTLLRGYCGARNYCYATTHAAPRRLAFLHSPKRVALPFSRKDGGAASATSVPQPVVSCFVDAVFLGVNVAVMTITVHHQPVDTSAICSLHAWQLAWDGNQVWDRPGTVRDKIVDFGFPEVDDPRQVDFLYLSTSTPCSQTTWEPNDFARQIVSPRVSEIWTFPSSARILYEEPQPAGVAFNAGSVLTINVLTGQRFRGGQIYAWNPYDPTNPTARFAESSRDDNSGVSTFTVTLTSWMTAGFHLKLVGRDDKGNDVWEPDSSNRVWRPCDGNSVWLKSGQCDVRKQPLMLTTLTLEVLIHASLSPAPTLSLQDAAEGTTITLISTTSQNYPGSPLFQVATYQPAIYPQAAYNLWANTGENLTITRPFPANPADLSEISRFALGAGGWVKAFPVVAATATLHIEPKAVFEF